MQWLHAESLPPWQTVLESFERMRELTSTRDVPVIVAVFPFNRAPSWEDYGYRNIHEQIVRTADACGFHAVDMLPEFERHAALDLRLSDHDEHPTPLGHRIAAEALLPAVREALGDPAAGDLDTVSAAWQ